MSTKQVFNPLSGNFDLISDTSALVAGPASSTDNAITRFDGTTGKLVQDSSATLDDAGKITAVDLNASSLTASRALQTDGSKNLQSSATTVTELGYVSGVTSAIQTQFSNKQPLDSTLTALAAYNTNGLVTQTAPDTFTGRTITGTVNQVLVSNGDGVSGNPTLSAPQNIHTGASPTFVTTQLSGLTTSTALVSDGSKNVTSSATTSTEIGYVSGVTSAIQTQINGKQATGNYITALTSDVTASGPGSAAATIAANVVSNTKLAQMAAHTYKGNSTGSTANAADITSTQLTADLNLFSSSLQGLVPASGGGTTNFLRADGTFAAPASGGISQLTGDVTAGPGSGSQAATIAASAVTNAKMANMAQSTIKGRAAGAGTGAPVDLTATQATAILNNFVGDSGSGGTAGLVPAPAAGDFAAGKTLSAGGTWVTDPSIAITNWATETDLTFTGFGTVSNLKAFSRRVGSDWEVTGTVTYGTPTGVSASINFASHTIDTTKMSTIQGTIVGQNNALITTSNLINTSGYQSWLHYDGSTNNSIFFATQVGSNVLNKALGSSITAGATNPMTFYFKVPISGWSASDNVNSINMRYFSSATSISSSLATITYATKDYDSNTAYSSGTYTVPAVGKYLVTASLLVTGTISINNTIIMEIQKNGTVVSRRTIYAPASLTDIPIALSDIISCAASDTLRIQLSTSIIAPSIVSSNFDNFLTITKTGY